MSTYNIIHHVTLTSAYGRDYFNATDARKAFCDGKDFICNHPLYPNKPCSKRDIMPGMDVTIRYNKQRKLVTFNITHS